MHIDSPFTSTFERIIDNNLNVIICVFLIVMNTRIIYLLINDALIFRAWNQHYTYIVRFTPDNVHKKVKGGRGRFSGVHQMTVAKIDG